jgi:hypothetical protein
MRITGCSDRAACRSSKNPGGCPPGFSLSIRSGATDQKFERQRVQTVN